MSQYNYRTDSPEEQLRAIFERLWKDRLIHIPPLDMMPFEQYNQLKEWAWVVFQEMRRA